MIPDTVRRYLDREATRRHHLVMYLSGAHAYGFPSPDSDYDLKCVHAAPTADLVGLTPREGGGDVIEVVDGIEIDYGSNEIGPVLRGALRGNGNYLERLLGACVLDEDAPRMRTLRPLLARTLSQRVHHHYAGFARSQLHAAVESQPPAAKKVLYVLRTTLTGAHLLGTGEVVTDLSVLAGPRGFPAAHDLIAAKRAGERTILDDATWVHWRTELDRAFATLHAALAASSLPAEPPDDAVAAVEAWLVELRRELF
jgi:predicted nucleotidyltransferase